MKTIEQLQAAKVALSKGDALGALDILKSVTNTAARIEACPACGVPNLLLVKSNQEMAECSSCSAAWGSSKPLVKSSSKTEESTKMMKGRPEIVARLWELYQPNDLTLTKADINNYALTGWINKSILTRLGVTDAAVTTGEDFAKASKIMAKNVSERTWGGLSKDQVLNTMLGMFKTGEEKTLVHRFSITKFEQADEIDFDVLKVVLVKAGKDPNSLSKDKLSKAVRALEDRDGIDTDLDPGQGRKLVPFKNLKVSNMEALVSKNPANGSTDDEMKSPKAEAPVAKSNLYFAPENRLNTSHTAGTKEGVYKSRASDEGFVLEFYPTKDNRFSIQKGAFALTTLGVYPSRLAAHEAAERHFAKAEPLPMPAGEASTGKKFGPHFLFSAENPRYTDKVSVKGGHDTTLAGLKAMGMDAHGTEGKYGKPERSIMVMNPSPSHIKSLHQIAAGLGQESGIESDGTNHKMVYYHGPNAGKYHKGSGTEHFKAGENDDFYTKDPTGDGHFRHSFDFDTLHDDKLGKSMRIAKSDKDQLQFEHDKPSQWHHTLSRFSHEDGKPRHPEDFTDSRAHASHGIYHVQPNVSGRYNLTYSPHAAEERKALGRFGSTMIGDHHKSRDAAHAAAQAHHESRTKIKKADGCAVSAGVGSMKPKGKDILMKDPVKKTIPPIAGGVESAAEPEMDKSKIVPPSVPGNKTIEQTQSSENTAHSLTPPKSPIAPAPDKMKALHAALGINANGTKIKKSEALDIINGKMEAIRKTAKPGHRELLRKYSELAVKVTLTNDSDWE
jgi:hypothetical protein